MANYLKLHVHSFIFKISSKDPSAKKADKWTVNLESFFSKVPPNTYLQLCSCLQGKSLPKVILFSSTTQKPSLLFRILSILYHYKVVFGQVSTKEEAELSAKYNIKGNNENVFMFFPAGSDEEHIVYTGEISRIKMRAFLDEQLAMKNKKKVTENSDNEL